MSRKRRAAARVRPVRRATSDSVSSGSSGAEGADDRQAALERLDEVLAALGHSSSSVFWAIATALLAAGTPA